MVVVEKRKKLVANIKKVKKKQNDEPEKNKYIIIFIKLDIIIFKIQHHQC